MSRTSAVAVAGGTVYLVTLVAAPLVDRAIDVQRAYPEDYAFGPAGVLVRLGYAAVALMVLAIAMLLAREGGAGRLVAAALLVAGATMSFVLAAAPQQVSGGVLLLGVLCLVAAPLVSSIAERRRLGRIAFALGVLVTVAFVALAVAPKDVAGLTNRAWDVLLALWGITFPLARSGHIVSGAATPSRRSV